MIVLGKKEIAQVMARLESFGPATCRKDVEDLEQLLPIKRKPVAKASAG